MNQAKNKKGVAETLAFNAGNSYTDLDILDTQGRV